MKIKNPWTKDPEFYTVDKPVYSIGDVKVYRQTKECHLYTLNGFAVSQLVTLNKRFAAWLYVGETPEEDTPMSYSFHRAKSCYKKQLADYQSFVTG